MNRKFFPAVLLAFVASIFLLSGCTHFDSEFINPYEHAEEGLDPADEGSWPNAWDSSKEQNATFASFVRYAQKNSHWILLAHKGEAVYVCPADPNTMSVRYQGGSNKVENMRIVGEFQAVSLRQYAHGYYMDFNADQDELNMRDATIRRNTAYIKRVPR